MRYIDADKIDYTVTMVGMDENAGYREIAFKSDIDDMPSADVAPKIEVARLEIELERAQRKGFPSYLQACSEEEAIKIGREYGKAEVAKQIFAEIDNALHNMAIEYANSGHKEYFAVCEMVHHKVIRPMEKKYVEGENDE